MSRREKGDKSLSIQVLRTTGFETIYKTSLPERKSILLKTFIDERLNRVDVFGLVELIEVGAAAKIENIKEADQILNTVSTYLSAPGELILKSLTGYGDIKSTKNIDRLRQAVKVVLEIKDQMNKLKKEETFEGKNNYIQRFINDLTNQIDQPTSDLEAKWSLMPVNGYGYNDALVKGRSDAEIALFYLEQNDKEKLLRQILSQIMAPDEKDEIQRIAHLPVFIIEQFQSSKEPNLFWDRQYGGASLRKIFAEEDPKNKKSLFLVFLNHVPRGDMFWHCIIDLCLFGEFGSVDEDGIHKTDNSATILGLQHAIASDLFINQPGNSQEVRNLLTVLAELKIPFNLLLSTLETSYYYYLTYISKEEQIFPDEIIEEFLETKDSLPMIFTDEIVDWYLKKNLEKIQAYLLANAPSEQMKNEIRQWARDKKKSNFTESHTAEILRSIRYLIGDKLWDLLFIDSQKKQRTEEIINDITSSVLERELWPEEEIYRVEKFEKGSLPYMLGISNIIFKFNPDHPEIMAAAIQLREPRSIAIIASIKKNENQLEISFSIDSKENKEILQLLELLVAVELEDNLADIKSEDGLKEEIGTPLRERSGELALIRRNLPAERTRATDETSDEISSGSLAERLNTRAVIKDREFKPRRVECHARHLSGALNYLQAIDNYLLFVSQHNIDQLSEKESLEYDSLFTDLRMTLGQMDTISDRKEELIPSLPDRVRKKIILVKDPLDGRERFIHTWVMAHVSPALDSLKAQDLWSYYAQYIKDNPGPRSAVYNPLLVEISK